MTINAVDKDPNSIIVRIRSWVASRTRRVLNSNFWRVFGFSSAPQVSTKSSSEEVHRAWLKAKGDKTLRLDYDLTEQSVVLDVGGFEGQWASDVFGKYLCDVHIFEPVTEHFEGISQRFLRNKRIHLYPFGLGASRRKESIAVAGDASSFVRLQPEGTQLLIDVVAAAEFLNENFPQTIDLVKINIEGAEYELLEHLISQRIVCRLKNIQVQFHDFVPHAPARMLEIQKCLALTHELTYQFPFVWENWQLKNNL